MNACFRRLLILLLVVAGGPAAANAYVDFFRAVNLDNAGAVQRLLAQGFDPNAADEQGQVALFLALRGAASRVVSTLLAHPGIKVDLANGSGETPLMMAALKGDLDVARQLVERGAQINRSGWAPLHYAASSAEGTAVLAWLLDRGALIDAPAPNGNTPLMMAARYGAIASAELLLARGADPRLINAAGLSAAELALREGRTRLAARLQAAAR